MLFRSISDSAFSDVSVAAVAFPTPPTPLDKMYSTQVFDTALSPVAHIVEPGQIATATAEHLSLTSPIAHPNNIPVIRYVVATPTLQCTFIC